MNYFQRLLIARWLKLTDYGSYNLMYAPSKIDANFVGKGGDNLVEAHIYKHVESGVLVYCNTKQASHGNHKYLGTAKVKEKNVVTCKFS